MSIARLSGVIQPKRCSIKYQPGGCRITLIKLDRTPWMNRICNDLCPEFDSQEDENQGPPAPAPIEAAILKGFGIPSPFNLVHLAPFQSSQPTTKRRPAPSPSFNVVHLAPSRSSQPTTKKRPAPPPPFNIVHLAPSRSPQPTTKMRPAPPPPFNVVHLAPSRSSQPRTKKWPAPSPPTN